jgi:hypothetical protein
VDELHAATATRSEAITKRCMAREFSPRAQRQVEYERDGLVIVPTCKSDRLFPAEGGRSTGLGPRLRLQQRQRVRSGQSDRQEEVDGAGFVSKGYADLRD